MKKLFVLIIICLGVVSICAQERAAIENQVPNPQQRTSISVSSMAMGITPTQMVETILGQGVSYSNVSYTGVLQAAGTYNTGIQAGLGIDSGIILSSGSAVGAVGPNNSPSYTTNNNNAGDVQLSALIGGETTWDACILEFDFIPQGNTIQFNFILASEEYPEYINYHDVFGFFLNGTNIALLPGTTTPISIGTINHLVNSQYYISNSPVRYDIQCDGFTTILPVLATVVPKQTHHIKLAVADMRDHIYDTWIFLQQNSFVSGADVSLQMNPIPVFNPNGTNSYSFEVSNNGPSKAQYVSVQIRLPYTFESFTAQAQVGTIWIDENCITWEIGSLGPGVELTLNVTATGLLYQSLNFAGYATTTTFDHVTGNNYFPLYLAPTATADSYQTDQGVPLNISSSAGLFANDISYSFQACDCVVVISPSHAAAFSANFNGGFSYTPAENYHGTDIFYYYFLDGNGGMSNTVAVTIVVNEVIALPAISLPNYVSFVKGNPLVIDMQPYISNVNTNHCSLSISGNELIQADVNGLFVTFNCIECDGSETITVTVCDSLQGLSASDQFMVEVLPALDCYETQFTSAPNGISPYNGTQVTIEGTVSAVANNGFFITDSGNGIYRGMYVQTDLEAAMQDLILVMGTVTEVNGFTTLANVTNCIVVAQNQTLPEPLLVNPGSIASEAYEGVLCKVQNVAVTIAPNPDQVFTVSNALGACLIDDAYFYPVDHIWPSITTGQTWQSITGVVVSRDGQYFLNPRSDADMIPSPASITNISITHSEGQINLSWTPVASASHYTIYHAEYPTGPWTLLDTTTATGISISPIPGHHFYYVTAETQP
ncbi:MAG: hypothetical protein CVU48_09805 [Candidatus Cloacimonetes bacterium HGW-Cloacimonetes-1]|nr:MAG: hypothetical protein CVU48_09805 [Candidatus Cloacimonetes bacterium HGW-Cloacimonetes-1]